MTRARKKVATGGPDDVFPTPAWCVRRLLEVWQPRPGGILEAGAGDGAIIRAATEMIGPRDWLVVESRATCAAALAKSSPTITVVTADFLTWAPTLGTLPRFISAGISNAPFTLNEAFIRRARELFPEADLAFFCRLGFLASEERDDFYRVHLGAPDLYVLPNRPGFTVDGQTDQHDYAWYVWPAGPPRACGTIRRLALTSPEERGKRPRKKAVRPVILPEAVRRGSDAVEAGAPAEPTGQPDDDAADTAEVGP